MQQGLAWLALAPLQLRGAVGCTGTPHLKGYRSVLSEPSSKVLGGLIQPAVQTKGTAPPDTRLT